MSLIVEATEGKAQLSIGTHTLRCTNIENDEVESLRDPLIWRFTFECEDEYDPNGNPIEIDGIASRYLTPNSKAWAWCEALGMKLEIGKRHNLEDGIGGRALGKIIHKKSPNGAEFARLDELMSLPKGAIQNAPPAVQEGADASPPAGTVDMLAWWTARTGEGFQRAAVVKLCAEMFEGRNPGELTAYELSGLTDELNSRA